MHVTEDDLILHYYGEASAAESGIESHLGACAECGAAWLQLRRVMEAIDTAHMPEPAPSFERDVWARLDAEIGRERPAGRVARGWRAWVTGPRLVLAGGLAAIVLVVGALRMSTTMEPRETLAADTAAGAHREQVMLTAVSDHIEQTQVVLVELANAQTGDDIDVSLERDAADDLVSASRLYRETARETGNLQLAALLEELEMVLVEIARGPGALSGGELAALRAQIEEQQLIFKLQVLGADVKARRRSAAEFKPQRTL